MTEDELLAQIRTIDPDAHVVEHDGFRVIVTDSISSHNIAFVNPANMAVFPFEMDFGERADDDVKVQIVDDPPSLLPDGRAHMRARSMEWFRDNYGMTDGSD